MLRVGANSYFSKIKKNKKQKHKKEKTLVDMVCVTTAMLQSGLITVAAVCIATINSSGEGDDSYIIIREYVSNTQTISLIIWSHSFIRLCEFMGRRHVKWYLKSSLTVLL